MVATLSFKKEIKNQRSQKKKIKKNDIILTVDVGTDPYKSEYKNVNEICILGLSSDTSFSAEEYLNYFFKKNDKWSSLYNFKRLVEIFKYMHENSVGNTFFTIGSLKIGLGYKFYHNIYDGLSPLLKKEIIFVNKSIKPQVYYINYPKLNEYIRKNVIQKKSVSDLLVDKKEVSEQLIDYNIDIKSIEETKPSINLLELQKISKDIDIMVNDLCNKSEQYLSELNTVVVENDSLKKEVLNLKKENESLLNDFLELNEWASKISQDIVDFKNKYEKLNSEVVDPEIINSLKEENLKLQNANNVLKKQLKNMIENI